MTMTPERRAREIWSAAVKLPKGGPIDLIALAIREAEDAALEDAAAAAYGAVLRAIDDGSPRGQVAVAAAFAVRYLKHNKD